MADHLLGPTLQATLCTPDLERSMAAWQGSLHHHVHEQGRLSAERAAQLGVSAMAGAPHAMLANELGEPWLELVENTAAVKLDPFVHSGWFSLEISVANVDQLRSTLDESMFTVIGEPANLEVSDNIRAMQVTGPAGEVLYLTEVRAAVPPFELPFARCAVDRLFIPVMLVEDRTSAAVVYERLNGHAGIKFDTRITVINNARGLDRAHRHPICTLQLAGSNLIEFDQVPGLQARPAAEGTLPAGIVSISLAVDALPDASTKQGSGAVVCQGHKHISLRGAGGELFELRV